jgi:hypothetical protein
MDPTFNKMYMDCNPSEISHRWGIIQQACNKWHGIQQEVMDQQESGASIEDLVRSAPLLADFYLQLFSQSCVVAMFEMYRTNNEDVEFKFIHVFKRIEKCDKWVLVRASLGKGKDITFDPTSPLPAVGQGRLEMGNKKAKQAREDALAMEWLQSSIKKCIAGVAMNYAAREGKEAAREVKFDAWWDKMFEK